MSAIRDALIRGAVFEAYRLRDSGDQDAYRAALAEVVHLDAVSILVELREAIAQADAWIDEQREQREAALELLRASSGLLEREPAIT